MAVDQSLRAAAPRRLREHAGEDRARRAAEAVRGDDVERVIELGLGAINQHAVARNPLRARPMMIADIGPT
jgi:hypothetical protein